MQQGYFIGLGSNIQPARNLAVALDRLVDAFGRLDISSIVETAPIGPMRGPFLNAVVHLQSDMAPASLKNRLSEIETALGRDRTDPGRGLKDRPIDFDILSVLPRHRRELFAAELAVECYYRPQMIELAHALGLTCAAPIEPFGPSTTIFLAGREIGHAPARLGEKFPRKVALVTGAAVRLGNAIAAGLAAEGYDIALHYNSSHEAAEAAARRIESLGGRCMLFQQDLSRLDAIGNLLDRVTDAYPQLDLLVNSASAYDKARIADTTPEMLDAQWTMNFKAPFFLIKEFARAVGSGSIINILDNKIAFNQYQYAAYLTAKKALAELTKMAALEFAPRIRVNGVAPGVVMPATDRADSYLEWRRKAIPTGQLGHPEQIVAAVAMLAANQFMTGQIMFVDGGESANLVGRDLLNSYEIGDRVPVGGHRPSSPEQLHGKAA